MMQEIENQSLWKFQTNKIRQEMETTWLLVHLVIFCQVEQFQCDEENGDFEMLPQPAAVASPERSGFDENQFKVEKNKKFFPETFYC